MGDWFFSGRKVRITVGKTSTDHPHEMQVVSDLVGSSRVETLHEYHSCQDYCQLSQVKPMLGVRTDM
jgi:hypothetical protein